MSERVAALTAAKRIQWEAGHLSEPHNRLERNHADAGVVIERIHEAVRLAEEILTQTTINEYQQRPRETQQRIAELASDLLVALTGGTE